MKISVLGAGNIGGTIGKKWANAGHEIVFGVRDENSPKVQALAKENISQVKITNVAKSLIGAEVVLISIPHAAVAEIAQDHSTALNGKIIIDSTNNFGAPVVSNVTTLQVAAPDAMIFRAFNSLGWEVFARPEFNEITADHFFCGPDGRARLIIQQLIGEVGLRPVYVGGLEYAAIVDAIGSLWVTLVFQRGMSRHMAFKILTE